MNLKAGVKSLLILQGAADGSEKPDSAVNQVVEEEITSRKRKLRAVVVFFHTTAFFLH